ncbi:carbonic anhydrase/acetyltransferase-like protein (isoleucine patch superfamily) [Microbacterium sp. W4I4]|uniref:gamma carbonic anhydrase family protein n=1 Tax=Microbacterium sp. W4I4 TaxID=3042295 RepID=UPI002781D5F6|nr:gamma carbonic anhydrase family protein [Microbacterium sp. W4I4]MDQ0613528.1 carbonic anhydrase/acetyltransferase-like protein (isoleucine patch superfamily) [Microbacterium sp. W4I4]
MIYEHLGARPRIHDTAVVAPTAVISGDVEIGPDCQVLHGAVITAEGGPITLGEHVIVMENALIRATAANAVHIGSHTLVGTLASIAGATVGEEVFFASGARVFNGALVGAHCEIRVNAIVQRRAVLPEGTVVPIGWVAAGDPVQLFSPDQADEIAQAMPELDFPGHVFGVDRDTPDLMVQLTERYASSLARHADDRHVGTTRAGLA